MKNRITLYTKFFSLILFLAQFSFSCTAVKDTLRKPKITKSNFFHPREYDKIAILVNNNTGRHYNEGMLNKVANIFSQSVISKGYHVANRRQTDEIKREINFENTGWTDRDFTEPGHLYNVSAIMIININESYVKKENNIISNFLYEAPDDIIYSIANIAVDLVSVREGETLWSGSYKGSKRISDYHFRSDAISKVSQEIAQKLPSR